MHFSFDFDCDRVVALDGAWGNACSAITKKAVFLHTITLKFFLLA